MTHARNKLFWLHKIYTIFSKDMIIQPKNFTNSSKSVSIVAITKNIQGFSEKYNILLEGLLTFA